MPLSVPHCLGVAWAGSRYRAGDMCIKGALFLLEQVSLNDRISTVRSHEGRHVRGRDRVVVRLGLPGRLGERGVMRRVVWKKMQRDSWLPDCGNWSKSTVRVKSNRSEVGLAPRHLPASTRPAIYCRRLCGAFTELARPLWLRETV